MTGAVMPGGDGRPQPGQLPARVAAFLAGEGGEWAGPYADALSAIQGVPRGRAPGDVPPMTAAALADIAWSEMVAGRMARGMSGDVACAQAAADIEAWLLAFAMAAAESGG